MDTANAIFPKARSSKLDMKVLGALLAAREAEMPASWK